MDVFSLASTSVAGEEGASKKHYCEQRHRERDQNATVVRLFGIDWNTEHVEGIQKDWNRREDPHCGENPENFLRKIELVFFDLF